MALAIGKAKASPCRLIGRIDKPEFGIYLDYKIQLGESQAKYCLFQAYFNSFSIILADGPGTFKETALRWKLA